MSELGRSAGRVARSPAFKFFLIAFLIQLLLIPLLIVGGLVFCLGLYGASSAARLETHAHPRA